MGSERSNPTREEVEATYRIVMGMALRKRFRTEQDREDFVQNVMLSAFRSYDAKLERALSFKNLTCGPAFRRAYQTYWRKFYSRGERLKPTQIPDSPVGLCQDLGSPNSERHPADRAQPLDAVIREARWSLEESDETDRARSFDLGSSAVEIESIGDEHSEDPSDRILMGVLAELIEGLEPPYGELIRCFLLGMTREEVAAKMQKSVSWAKKYTLAALERLLRQLKRRGVLIETFELEHILS